MTWTSPRPERLVPPPSGDERTQLEAWLDHHRQTLLVKCAGLTPEQLAARSVPPSTMSLLGLLRHMADVERSWFRRRIAGQDLPFLYSDVVDNPDGDFDDASPATAEADWDIFLNEVELARQTAEGRSLEDTFFHRQHEQEMDVRWVYLHMIEEYARHNGHADLLRERIDGVTGS
ncbi:DinB family protein [Nonomuraea sp. NBC_01738]|uniref:DinB family protein n=1 Tax=Nonomuraea sp. NBC_01738 TaxID=2976003 RepID=UPI002E14D248|nr:DinB family protein [Nonomuraea sp. NBC_01738]